MLQTNIKGIGKTQFYDKENFYLVAWSNYYKKLTLVVKRCYFSSISYALKDEWHRNVTVFLILVSSRQEIAINVIYLLPKLFDIFFAILLDLFSVAKNNNSFSRNFQKNIMLCTTSLKSV